jgi:hypothetical protein
MRLQLASVPATANVVMSVCDLLLPKETFTRPQVLRFAVGAHDRSWPILLQKSKNWGVENRPESRRKEKVAFTAVATRPGEVPDGMSSRSKGHVFFREAPTRPGKVGPPSPKTFATISAHLGSAASVAWRPLRVKTGSRCGPPAIRRPLAGLSECNGRRPCPFRMTLQPIREALPAWKLSIQHPGAAGPGASFILRPARDHDSRW